MKRFILCGLLTFLVVNLSICIVFAKDSEDKSLIYNNSVYPEANYKPFSETTAITSVKDEVIYPATGNMEIRKTDLTLKGRNGMDFVLGRYYSLFGSNIYEPCVESQTQTVTGWTYKVSGVCAKTTTVFDLTTGSIVSSVTDNTAYTDGYYDTLPEADDAAARYNSGYYNYDDEKIDGSSMYWETVEFSNFTTEYINIQNPVNYYTYTQSIDGKPLTEKYYDIGAGWAFDLPYIERRNINSGVTGNDYSRDYLHYGSSGTWEITFGADGGDSNLKDYPLKDIVINIDGGSYSNGQMTSAFVLTQKNGTKTYFGTDGRLLGVKDRFGNEIKFQHTIRNDYPVITKIIDSVQREIDIAYNASDVTLTVTDAYDLQNVMTVKYNKSAVTGHTGKYFLSSVQYIDVKPGENVSEYYNYTLSDARIDFLKKLPLQGSTNYYACLDRIRYNSDTSGAEPAENFEYEKFTKNCGSQGSMELYRISEVSYNDIDSYKTTKENQFTYNEDSQNNIGQFDGYPNYDYKEEIPSGYKVETGAANYYNTGTYTFNNKLLCTGIESQGPSHKNETFYEYDTVRNLVTKVINKAYNYGTTNYTKKVENYTYDDYRSMTGYWDTQADRDANDEPVDNEHKYIYTYNSTYKYMTSKTYKKDSNTTILEEFTPSADDKKIEWHKIYENAALKEQTNYYSYDSYGNLTEERRYLDNWTDYVTKKYDYSDNVAARNGQFDGAYLTRQWYEDVRDADGNLVTARQGQNPGVVDEIYIYDWFGNIVEKQSPNGGNSKITYFYDKMGRKISEAMPGFPSKTFDINDEDFNRIEQDQNGNQIITQYNSMGRAVFKGEYSTADGIGETFNYCEFDVNGVLTGEYNQDKTSVEYEYNSDYTLKSKKVYERFTWFNDSLPPGAVPSAVNEDTAWDWRYTDESVSTYHKSPNYSGMHEHSFDNSDIKMKVNSGDIIFAEVRLSSTYPVSEIMLQWKDENNSWEHRAFWGADIINLGTSDTESRQCIGGLPDDGQWVTLKVNAEDVGLAGKTVSGMKFTLYNGEADWNRVGIHRGGTSKILSEERYEYDYSALNGTAVKITKQVYNNETGETTDTAAYINNAGFTIRTETYSDTDYDGIKDKIYMNTYRYDYIGNKTQEKTARAYDEENDQDPEVYEKWIDPSTSQPYEWTSKFEYDYKGRLTNSYNIEGGCESKSYDSIGRLVKLTDIKGNKVNPKYSTTCTYDSMGRLLKVETPFEEVGGTIYYSAEKSYYDRNGNLVKALQQCNKYNQAESFRRTDYEYSDRNLLLMVTTYDSGSPENYTQYYYDNAGNKLRMYTGLSSPLTITGLDIVTDNGDTDYAITKYDYDNLNRLESVTDPLNKEESYTYDNSGNIIEKTDRKNNSFKFNYDGMNRLTTSFVSCTDSSENAYYIYMYDGFGNRIGTRGGTIENQTFNDMGYSISDRSSKEEIKPAFSSRVDVRSESTENFGTSSFVKRDDGKVLAAYTKNFSVMLSTADSEEDIFNTPNELRANETVIYTMYSSKDENKLTELQKLANGNYLLYINEHGVKGDSTKPNKLIVYESTDGGQTFSYKSTVRNFDMTSITQSVQDDCVVVGNAIQLPNGRIVVPFGGYSLRYSYQGWGGVFSAYSDDNGATWSVVDVYTNTYIKPTFGIAKFGNMLVMQLNNYYFSGSSYFNYSTDNGKTWSRMSSNITAGKGLFSQLYWGEGDGYSYWVYRETSLPNEVWIYRRKDTAVLPVTDQAPYIKGGTSATWEGPLNTSALPISITNLIVTDEGSIALTGRYSYLTYNRSCIIQGSRKIKRTSEYNAHGLITAELILNIAGLSIDSVLYAYDNMDRLEYVKDSGQEVAHYTYDDNGNRLGLTYSNGNSATYTYNLANKLVSLSNYDDGNLISQYTYTYNLDGNIESKTDSNGTTYYEYDGLGRLYSVTEQNGTLTTYSFDDYNNRSYKTAVSGQTTTVVSYSYNAGCRLLSETTTVNGTPASTVNYQYDDNGNMTSDGTKTYKYDGFNQLIEVQAGVSKYLYSYNGDGIRTSKVIDGTATNFINKGGNVAFELDSNGDTQRKNIWGINLIASDFNSIRRFYLYNGHGDVEQLTDTTGGVIKVYDYDEFGNERNIDVHDTNPFRYCAEYWDKETGTIYLRARYYNPGIGVFITEDSFRGYGDDPLSLNYYLYCKADPVNRIDPTGFDSWVFYSGDVGDPNRFRKGAKEEGERLQGQYKYKNKDQIHLIPINTPAQFKEAWKQMTESGLVIDEVSLFFHGGADYLEIRDPETDRWAYIKVDEPTKDTDVWIRDLAQANIPTLNLLACNGGNIDYKNNVATTFLNSQKGISQVKAYDGYLRLGSVIGYYYFTVDHLGKYKSDGPGGYFNGKSRKPVGRLLYTRNDYGKIKYEKIQSYIPLWW